MSTPGCGCGSNPQAQNLSDTPNVAISAVGLAINVALLAGAFYIGRKTNVLKSIKRGKK